MESLVRVQPVNFVLKCQVVVLVVMSLIFFGWQGVAAAKASTYGASMAIASTLLLKWHLVRAAKTARADAAKNLSKAYRCVAERWFLTIVLFAVGLSVLALSPLPLLIGFTLTQLMLFLGNTNWA